jgi:hypothetical protein
MEIHTRLAAQLEAFDGLPRARLPRQGGGSRLAASESSQSHRPDFLCIRMTKRNEEM